MLPVPATVIPPNMTGLSTRRPIMPRSTAAWIFSCVVRDRTVEHGGVKPDLTIGPAGVSAIGGQKKACTHRSSSGMIDP